MLYLEGGGGRERGYEGREGVREGRVRREGGKREEEGRGREGGRREEEGRGVIQREIESKDHTTTYMYILSHTSTQTRVVQFPFHSFLLMVHWDGMDSGI